MVAVGAIGLLVLGSTISNALNGMAGRAGVFIRLRFSVILTVGFLMVDVAAATLRAASGRILPTGLTCATIEPTAKITNAKAAAVPPFNPFSVITCAFP